MKNVLVGIITRVKLALKKLYFRLSDRCPECGGEFKPQYQGRECEVCGRRESWKL